MADQISIKRQPVESSAIRSIGYDEASQTLEVEFHNFLVYQYKEVSLEHWLNMMEDESIGKYFNQVIKYSHQSVQVPYNK